MTQAQQRCLGGDSEAATSSWAATQRVHPGRVYGRVRLTLDRRLVENDALTTEGRSRLLDAAQAPAGGQIVLDAGAQAVVIPEAAQMLAEARRRGADVVVEASSWRIRNAWCRAIDAGGVSPW